MVSLAQQVHWALGLFRPNIFKHFKVVDLELVIDDSSSELQCQSSSKKVGKTETQSTLSFRGRAIYCTQFFMKLKLHL